MNVNLPVTVDITWNLDVYYVSQVVVTKVGFAGNRRSGCGYNIIRWGNTRSVPVEGQCTARFGRQIGDTFLFNKYCATV